MTSLRRHVQILWTVAFLLMAGGLVLQAQEKFSCADDHAELHSSDAAKSDSCPAEEHCCNLCGTASLFLTESAGLPALLSLSQSYHSRDASYTEAPPAEIDYPPQLS